VADSGYGPVSGSGEHGNDCSGSIHGIAERLSACQEDHSSFVLVRLLENAIMSLITPV
jgi:hypothetical protein